MASEKAALSVTTRKDAVLWGWRAHNEVSILLNLDRAAILQNVEASLHFRMIRKVNSSIKLCKSKCQVTSEIELQE